ncbi:MAG: GTP pyrophosphokinase family protein, partial [Lachnospiraceae bacterium]|nr:GTP pyrophosphokinase family protein [Lachnospiraceae bacterium]
MEENGVSIYGQNQPAMNYVMQSLMDNINKLRTGMKEETGSDPVEHCLARIKSEDSMREKCERRNLPVTTQFALEVLTDAIGLRVVCAFIKDVYLVRDYLDQLPGCDIVEEKDYIKHAKPNG